MANICCDDVIFYTEGNPEGLYDLWEDLETYIILNQNPDLCWIGNLFSHKKIDSTGISLRGNVSYMEWNDTYILLSLETAWTPLYEAYQAIAAGLNFPTDGITVSTVGPVNQLKKLREEHLKIQLTISLHAATQAARNCIIPHMHMYAIEDVVKQALSYSQRHNRKVVFAYLLLPGINDRSSDIRQLAKWFKGKNVMINVLQYNPTSNSKIRAPQKQEMVAFKHQLEQTGLEVTMRVSHGREIKAACGQLANTYNKAKKQQK